MSNKNETSPSLKRSWFQELKAEFKKITWPKKESLLKQAVAVMVIALVIGCIIAGLDSLLKEGILYIVGNVG